MVMGGNGMRFDHIDRSETLDEMSLLFIAVQQLGQALANHTHGASFRHAHELNELLYMARRKLDVIQAELEETGQVMGADELVITTARLTTQFVR